MARFLEDRNLAGGIGTAALGGKQTLFSQREFIDRRCWEGDTAVVEAAVQPLHEAPKSRLATRQVGFSFST